MSRARRQLTKKKQRQRRRQKAAKERDKQEEDAENLRLANPEYQKWLKIQEELEEFQSRAAERVQEEAEEAWLRREAIAQRQFSIDEAKRRQEQEEVERLQQKQAQERAEREETLRKQREELRQRKAKAAAEFEAMMQSMQQYLNDPSIEQPPQHLLRVMETHPEERPASSSAAPTAAVTAIAAPSTTAVPCWPASCSFATSSVTHCCRSDAQNPTSTLGRTRTWS